MLKITLLFLLTFMFGCHSKSKNAINFTEVKHDVKKEINETIVEISALDSVKLDINFKPKGNYNTVINKIKADKSYFKNLYAIDKGKAIDSASKYMYSKLLNDIVPHWYGTPWDFNGHTNMPNHGEIACGYFVSTTLKHLGFNLNRYKMAQAAGLDGAKLIQPITDIKRYSNLSFLQLKNKVNSVYSNGIYFVGLDNHVGYVIIKDRKLYFLHSSYCDDKVVIELAEMSPCFRSNIYVFAEISTNKKLVKSWILDERLSISPH
ncbi:hypothetical protein [uncultured Winogradskyella sp.]|uniref:hypothetical protein n=1 Tax=uncultured Winogradskyella sp. TaxID=395353 RepID=UPI0026383328|nr:hypothetical protein [uncultured Winogradskyella sp.]